MSVKLTKTLIKRFDDGEVSSIGVNPNIRVTQQYSLNVITVKIEKVIRQDLTRDAEVEIRHETILEQSFTRSDFPMLTDHKSFTVEYNVLSNSFEILDTLNFGKSNKTRAPSYHINGLHRDINKRYNENFLPIFFIKTFDSGIPGFDCGLINFYVQSLESLASSTVILNSDVEEMTILERQEWINANLVSYLTFVIKNEDGSQIINAEQTRLFALTENNEVIVSNEQTKSNKYKVSLPAAKYTVQVNVVKQLYPENVNTYNIRVVNGYVNKTRVSSGAGAFTVKVDVAELDSGDFSKLKFDIGQFESYAELWIEIS